MDMILKESKIELRYGENPHESAKVYGEPAFKILHEGKQISFNNILDAEGAWVVASNLKAIEGYGAVVVKHQSICGAAVSNDPVQAIVDAIKADDESSYGGILAVNFEMTGQIARSFKKYLEVIVAPSFTQDAIEHFSKKKVRLLAVGDYKPLVVRGAFGAVLVSERKLPGLDFELVAGKEAPERMLNDLKFSYIVVEGVKSNAVLIAKGLKTVGIGGGQPSRKRAAEIAVRLSGKEAEGAVAASDAFFPFPDGLEILARAGVKAVVAPLGSKRDEEVLEAAEKLGISFYKAPSRVFRH